MQSLDSIAQILKLDRVKEFITLAESITSHNRQFIKNGIGVNFSRNGIESFKLYYNWVHPLSNEEIKALHFGSSTEAYEQHMALLNNSHFNADLDFAHGVTFAIKIDKYLNISLAHFIMPDIKPDDPFFSLTPVKEYYLSENELPVYKRKGIFCITDENGKAHTKDYYYIHSPLLKSIVNRDYKLDVDIAPFVEWVIGKGHYANSNSSDEKINLLQNYDEVFRKYGLDADWEEMSAFTKTMWNTYKLNAYCPGFYKNKEIRSMYYFNTENAGNMKVDSVSKLLSLS